MLNTKELMHCHCGTNNRVPRLTFTDPCKPEVKPGAREESASPVWLAAPAMNARMNGINAMIILLHIFDVIANEKSRYKRNALE